MLKHKKWDSSAAVVYCVDTVSQSRLIFNATTFELMVAINVPIEDPTREMTLYHYIQFSSRVNNSHNSYFVVPRPETEFLGVSLKTKTYIELSAGDLTMCKQLPGKKVCPKTAITLGGAEENVKFAETKKKLPGRS